MTARTVGRSAGAPAARLSKSTGRGSQGKVNARPVDFPLGNGDPAPRAGVDGSLVEVTLVVRVRAGTAIAHRAAGSFPAQSVVDRVVHADVVATHAVAAFIADAAVAVVDAGLDVIARRDDHRVILPCHAIRHVVWRNDAVAAFDAVLAEESHCDHHPLVRARNSLRTCGEQSKAMPSTKSE